MPPTSLLSPERRTSIKPHAPVLLSGVMFLLINRNNNVYTRTVGVCWYFVYLQRGRK